MVSSLYAGGVEDGRYLSTFTVYAKEARRNLFFHPPKLGDPPPTINTYGRAHSSFVPLTAAAVTVTKQYAAVAYRSPPSSIIVLWKALYRGGGRLPTGSGLRSFLYSGGRRALYRPLCWFLYSRGGRLCTVPCVRFIQQGGTALCRPLCSVYITGGNSSLPSPACSFLYTPNATESCGLMHGGSSKTALYQMQ